MKFENAWWRTYSKPYYWFEVTRRDDIGENLEARLNNKENWTHLILKYMYPGDLVIHYDTNLKAIVGVSEVKNEYKIVSKNNKRHRVVKLNNYSKIQKVTLHQIQKKNDKIKDIIEDLKKRSKSKTYFPVSPSTSKRKSLSVNQVYACIVNQNFVDLFPKLNEALNSLREGKKLRKSTIIINTNSSDVPGGEILEKKVQKHIDKEVEFIKTKQTIINNLKKERKYKCEGCGLKFENIYGNYNKLKNFIEAHHIIPKELAKKNLKTGGRGRKVKEKDIVMLCSN